jgi:hypothetical protein
VQLGILDQPGQKAVMDGNDAVSAQKQIEFSAVDVAVFFPLQWMDREINVIVK